MKKILILFAAMILFACSASAQVGSSGHFSFEVPDDWEFMVYDGDTGWYAEDGVLFVLEYDYTEYGLFNQETIMDMYCKGKDIETYFNEFRYEQLNGKTVAYYSMHEGAYCFEYYQNGYAMTLMYSDKSKDTRKAEEILLPIAATVKYDTQTQNGYKMVQKETAYFQFGIPEGWSYLEQDGNHFAFNGKIGETKKGYYFVKVDTIEGLGEATEEVIRAAMDMVKTSYTDMHSNYWEGYSEHFEINGCPAYLSHGCARGNAYIYTSILLCANGDQLAMCIYMNEQEAFDDDFHVGLIEALAEQVKPL